MIKVCVVTFYKHNYGAFLQAYSLQKFLNQEGFDAEVLNYDYSKDHTILGVHVSYLKNPISFLKKLFYKVKGFKKQRKINKIFNLSVEKNIKETKYYKHYSSVKKNSPIADIFISGSDQVWNPTMAKQGRDSRFLAFNTKNAVIASYAASIGMDYLNGELKNYFKQKINKFDFVSVREERSIVTLRDITDKQIFVHKDPTLLLEISTWDKFQQPPKEKQPYIFVYLAQKSNELIDYAIKLSNTTGYEIVNCPGTANVKIDSAINKNRVCSPMEFVGYIKNAEYVITNSFHGLSFTIQYKKKAYVILPPKGASRHKELISKMKLDRLLNPTYIDDNEIENIYSSVSPYLTEQREETKKYFNLLKETFRTKNESQKK